MPRPCRALRAAADWLPGGLDARALRVLGKALSYTQNTGETELRLAFDGLVADGSQADAAVTTAGSGGDLVRPDETHGEDAIGGPSQRGSFLPGGQVPEFHGLVIRPRGDQPAIRADGDGPHGLGVGDLPAGIDLAEVKEAGGAIDTRREEFFAIGAEHRRGDPVGMPT